MATYHVQQGDEVKVYSEIKLRSKLRNRELTGLELVREDGSEDWGPVHDLALFREEVPFTGDPRDAARRRLANGFFSHLSIFAVISLGLSLAWGGPPFWLAFWAIALGFHGIKATPAIFGLIRDGKLLSPKPEPGALSGASPNPEDRLLSDPTRRPHHEEADRIRALLADNDQAEPLLLEVDRIVTQLDEMDERVRDLEAQTSARERADLQKELWEARDRRDRATDQTRALFEKQVEALESRKALMEETLELCTRLQAARSVALNQLKRLRLELSSGAAKRVALADLEAQLVDIRIEAEALDEVEALLEAENR